MLMRVDDRSLFRHFSGTVHVSFLPNICSEKAGRLKLIRDRSLPQRGKKGPRQDFNWLFEAAEILAGAKKDHDL